MATFDSSYLTQQQASLLLSQINLNELTGDSTGFKAKINRSFFSNYEKLVSEVTKPWASLQDNLYKLAKSSGLMLDIVSLNAIALNELTRELGITGEAIGKYNGDITNKIGRNVALGDISAKQYGTISLLTGKEGETIAQELLNFGLGFEDSYNVVSEIFKASTNIGINLKKASENFSKNIAKANTYTFQNGIRGLREMANRAAEVNLSMENTFNLAKKLNGKEGLMNAIQTGANLQVLGGTFAQGSNPLEMFYEATSDINSLQERIIKMFKGMGTYDKEKGVVYSRENRMRIQAAAEQMGLSSDDIFKMMNTDVTKQEIGKVITANYSSIMDGVTGATAEETAQRKKDYAELIKNTARMENGVAKVSIGMKDYDVSSLDAGLLKELELQNRMGRDSGETLTDIAINVRSIAEKEKALKNLEKESYIKDVNDGNLGTNLLDKYRQAFESIGSFTDDDFEKRGITDSTIQGQIRDNANEIAGLLIDAITNAATNFSNATPSSLKSWENTGANQLLISNGDFNKYLDTLLGDRSTTLKTRYEQMMGFITGSFNAPSTTLTINPDDLIRNFGLNHGGPVTVAHDNGGTLQPATASARELVANGGFTNNYYNQLGPVVNTQWGPERMLTESHAMGNSIGMNEYVLSSKALANMGDGNIEKGIQKADMINFGGVKPFATGGEIKISERPTAYYSGGTLTSNGSFNASGNINVTMPNLGGRITVALEGTNKNKEFDINANADAILNAIIPKLNSHIQRVFLNGPGQGENINNDTRWIG